MLLGSAQVETTLLALKIAFLVLLYLFIWRIVRSAARDIRVPQESMILGPQQAAALGLVAPPPAAYEFGSFVVLQSPELEEGAAFALGVEPLSVGRGAVNDIVLAGDEFSSTRHARFEPRRDGVYVEDVGSTNGTFVNDELLDPRAAPDARRRDPDRRHLPEVRRMTNLRLGQAAGETDTGRKRRRNEDAFVCAPPLFAVADGMGGAQAGEVASGLAAAALRETQVDAGGEERVGELVREANRRVHQRATSDAAASGMGTTMTVAFVAPDGIVWFGHVGDSRAYLLRGGKLEQLTDDHSLVAELVRRGELSPAQAEVHPQRSVITRALGTDPEVAVDTFSLEPEPGDVVLLCSDGLSSFVAGPTIEQIITRFRHDLRGAAHGLIHAANRAGGDDNITAVLFELVADGKTEPDERTREYPTAPDDAVTIHPGDGVRLPAADDTMVMPAVAVQTAEAGPGKRALALLVIVVLIALIALLVWRGLAN